MENEKFNFVFLNCYQDNFVIALHLIYACRDFQNKTFFVFQFIIVDEFCF